MVLVYVKLQATMHYYYIYIYIYTHTQNSYQVITNQIQKKNQRIILFFCKNILNKNYIQSYILIQILYIFACLIFKHSNLCPHKVW